MEMKFEDMKHPLQTVELINNKTFPSFDQCSSIGISTLRDVFFQELFQTQSTSAAISHLLKALSIYA